jgi:[protein-PII] uridylyltransferase
MHDSAFLEFLPLFIESMPDAYRERYDALGMTAHARVAYGRAERSLAAGTFADRELAQGVVPVCLVAEDRPGLLSSFSAALVLSDLDVVRAEAYTRRIRASGPAEAVDLFWLRNLDPKSRARGPGDQQLARLRALAIALLDGAHDVTSLAMRHRAGAAGVAAGASIRMLRAPNGWLRAIEVRTVDRPGLLFCITSALFALRLQIARCEAKSVRGRVLDRFYVEELDGAPVAPRRVAEIEQDLAAVLGGPKNRAVSSTSAARG